MKLKTLFILKAVLVLTVLANSSCQTKKTAEAPKTGASEAASLGDNGLLKNVKQLTFEGRRSGEGYFSADGSKMIFQSERDSKNPFYQIFVTDFNTGKTELVSTGSGKTTCAWIHPQGKKVMFSSTHLDPEMNKKITEEFESRKSAQKKKYSWSYDDNYDIFESSISGKNIKRLTKEKGYDAEGSYSPDGRLIAFASNRAGYTENLSDEDKKFFEQDPSYMMDIYIMNADGSKVRRLTTSKGYDGGPFFSADGKKITWRRFTPNGQVAEIHTMNIDGSEQKAVTKLNVMSWAPFFHPSGDYIVFTTNKLGYSNFELYIVDAEGSKDPVRVTFVDGFDGLPVFTPDGKKLSWTKNNLQGESQIFIADWDDQKARELLGLKAKSAASDLPLAKTAPALQIEDLKSWVNYLASEEMAGRATGSPEELIYTQKIEDYFKDLKLSPLNTKDKNKEYFNVFEFTSQVQLDEKNQLTVNNEAADKNEFTPLSFSKTGEFKEAAVAFAGYGIVAPASDSQPVYDAYKDLDVKDKWVLVFRDLPEEISAPARIHLNLYARLHHKAMVARNQGAVGLLLVNGPQSKATKLVKLQYESGFAEAGIPVINISDRLAEKLVANSKKSLKEWQISLDKGEIQNTTLESKVQAFVDLKFEKSKGRNVLAKLTVPGAKTSIVIGAHGDHLGHGEMGSSLAGNNEKGHTHYGADDNASGVAAVLELAQYFSDQQKAGKLKLKQNIIFAVWSGEEAGLLGSTHFLKSTDEKISSYLNLDMVGRLRTQLVIQGVGSSSKWKSVLESELIKSSLPVIMQEDPYVPSDAMAFYMSQIPSLTFFTGSHAEYHSPRDRAETLNYQGLLQISELIKNLSLKLASADQKALPYQKVESSKKKLEGRSFRIYLGTIPDYTQEGVKGVRITGTSAQSPAEKAGLVAGDIIVELAQTKIENLYDYVYCLQAMKAGQETTIKIQRQGKLLELPILPTLKE